MQAPSCLLVHLREFGSIRPSTDHQGVPPLDSNRTPPVTPREVVGGRAVGVQAIKVRSFCAVDHGWEKEKARAQLVTCIITWL